MIDIHCHLLPNIDDGPDNIEITKQMIQRFVDDGVNTVVCTPHYYSSEVSMQTFLKNRTSSYKSISGIYDKDIKLIVGSETYLTKYLFVNENLDDICINKKSYLLLELPYLTEINSFIKESIHRIINCYEKIPVLAHIERYPSIINNKKNLNYLVDIGCYMQINAGSFSKILLSKKLIKLIDKGLIHVIGSDAHNTTSRPPNLKFGIDKIKKALSIDAVNRLMSNAQNIIEGLPIE